MPLTETDNTFLCRASLQRAISHVREIKAWQEGFVFIWQHELWHRSLLPREVFRLLISERKLLSQAYRHVSASSIINIINKIFVKQLKGEVWTMSRVAVRHKDHCFVSDESWCLISIITPLIMQIVPHFIHSHISPTLWALKYWKLSTIQSYSVSLQKRQMI